MRWGLLVSSWYLLLMLSAPSASLSMTVEMSISGNCVTPSQQLHWKWEMRIILLITAEASSSSVMPIYVWFNEGTEGWKDTAGEYEILPQIDTLVQFRMDRRKKEKKGS